MNPIDMQSFVYPSTYAVHASWYDSYQAHDIAIINAQMTTQNLSAQLFFRFAPLISMFMSEAFKEKLGVTSEAGVALYANQGQHTRERHSREAFEILGTLPKAEDQLTYIGRTQHREGKFELVFNHKPGRHLYMGMKFIAGAAARSTQDECWIETAYVIDDCGLEKKIRTKKLSAT